MTAARLTGKNFDLYYALPEWERVSHRTVSLYMFFANVVNIEKIVEQPKEDILPDGNKVYKITYNGLH